MLYSGLDSVKVMDPDDLIGEKKRRFMYFYGGRRVYDSDQLFLSIPY